MSIQNTLDEMADHFRTHLSGYISGGYDFEGLPIPRRALSVYKNDLRRPAINETDDEYLANIYPFVLLRAPSGSTSSDGIDAVENAVSVVAVIGIHAPLPDMQGHADVCDLIDRIIAVAREHPYTAHCRIDPDVSWQLDEGETHPYYYGAVTLTAYDRLTTRAEYDI